MEEEQCHHYIEVVCQTTKRHFYIVLKNHDFIIEDITRCSLSSLNSSEEKQSEKPIIDNQARVKSLMRTKVAQIFGLNFLSMSSALQGCFIFAQNKYKSRFKNITQSQLENFKMKISSRVCEVQTSCNLCF